MEATRVIIWWLALVVLVSCASPVTELPDGSGGHAAPPIALTLKMPCADSLESVYVEPTDLEPYEASQRGEVVRCAVDRTLSAEQIQQALVDMKVVDIAVNSAVRV